MSIEHDTFIHVVSCTPYIYMYMYVRHCLSGLGGLGSLFYLSTFLPCYCPMHMYCHVYNVYVHVYVHERVHCIGATEAE